MNRKLPLLLSVFGCAVGLAAGDAAAQAKFNLRWGHYLADSPFVQLEKDFIKDCLPVNAVGLSIDEFLTYIDYIADRRLEGVGLTPLNPGIKNPLPWLAEMMDIKKEQNFFEGRVTEYQKSSALAVASDDEL